MQVHGPYASGLPPGALTWLRAVLSLQKEAERVLFNDPDPATGFLLNAREPAAPAPPRSAACAAGSRAVRPSGPLPGRP